MSKRFGYAAFGFDARKQQLDLRRLCEELEDCIEELGPSRATSLALTKLEECYMWVGKALQDKQLQDEADA